MVKKPTADVNKLLTFVAGSTAGDRYVYNVGATVLRRNIRDLAWRLYEAGYVHLVQQRDAANHLEYVMIRSAKPVKESLWRQFGFEAQTATAMGEC